MVFNALVEQGLQVPFGHLIIVYFAVIFREYFKIFRIEFNAGESLAVPDVNIGPLTHPVSADVVGKTFPIHGFSAWFVGPDRSSSWRTGTDFTQTQFSGLGNTLLIMFECKFAVDREARQRPHMFIGYQAKVVQFPAPDVVVVLEDVIFGGSEIKMRFMIEDVVLAEKDVVGIEIGQGRIDLEKVGRITSLPAGENNIFAKANGFEGTADNGQPGLFDKVANRIPNRVAQAIVSVVDDAFS